MPSGRFDAKIQVLDEFNASLGLMSVGDALRLATEKELDLVEIDPNANPPICRIVDYGKFRYEEAKQKKLPASIIPFHPKRK